VSTRPCPKGMTLMPSSEPAAASNLIGGCAGSEFGCCSDGTTYAIAKPCPVNQPVI
jgi:hypothetical protein